MDSEINNIKMEFYSLLSKLLSSEAEEERFGKVQSVLFEYLHSFTLNMTKISFKEMVDLKALCFCFPKPPLIYPKTQEEAVELWQSGATISIQALEKRSYFFNEVCKKVAENLGYEVTCSMYISKPDGISFSYHVDEWEGLALQVVGEKVFKIKDDNGNIADYILKPSNWLRISPEDVHLAETNEYSVHLNFALHRKFKLS